MARGAGYGYFSSEAAPHASGEQGVRSPTTPCLIYPGLVLAGGEGNGYFGSVGRRFDSCSRESGIAQRKSSRQRKLEP